MEATKKIWVSGDLVDWDDAKVHLAAHGLHYGTGVFEGMRAYETPQGPAVFRLEEHLERIEDSARILQIDLPFSRAELRSAIHELIAANGIPEVYIRPIAFYGSDELFVTGTAAEITPVRAIDDIEVAAPGPVTREIQAAYDRIVHGQDVRFAHFLDHVPQAAPAGG